MCGFITQIKKIGKKKQAFLRKIIPIQINTTITAAISSIVGLSGMLSGILEIILPKIWVQVLCGCHFLKIPDFNFQNIILFN
jgi:hypothetical protein